MPRNNWRLNAGIIYPVTSRNSLHFTKLVWLVIAALMVGGCNQRNVVPTTSPVDTTPANPASTVPTLTPTPFVPSPTPAPLAARVNGVDISLAQYQSELARYQAALGRDLAPEDQKRVLDDLIDQILLSQAAAEKGFVVEESLLQQRLNVLTNGLGGAQALTSWLAANGYTEEDFRRDLTRSIAAAWMRDQITAAVPETAEQVHARQILVYKPEQANEVLAAIQQGNDFEDLAVNYNAVTGGDLGWFPRGYLPDPAIEEAAFALQPDQTSGIIETPTGFHILQVIERDPERPLEPEARLALQAKALQNWLETRRSQSEIEIKLP